MTRAHIARLIAADLLSRNPDGYRKGGEFVRNPHDPDVEMYEKTLEYLVTLRAKMEKGKGQA